MAEPELELEPEPTADTAADWTGELEDGELR